MCRKQYGELACKSSGIKVKHLIIIFHPNSALSFYADHLFVI